MAARRGGAQRPVLIFSHGQESGPWGTKIQAMAAAAKNLGCRAESIDYQGIADPKDRVQKLVAEAGRIDDRLSAAAEQLDVASRAIDGREIVALDRLLYAYLRARIAAVSSAGACGSVHSGSDGRGCFLARCPQVALNPTDSAEGTR